MDSHTEKYLPWFILQILPHLSPRQLKRLIRHFSAGTAADSDPESPNIASAILGASANTLKTVKGLSPRAVTSILNHKDHIAAARKNFDAAVSLDLDIIVQAAPEYPALLREIPDPPLILFSRGELRAEAPCIAIVGSRKATAYGISTAQYLAKKLTVLGFTVVSGMALGIDTAAHQGALSGPGRTLAVLGSGHSRLYPRQNLKLSHHISRSGAVVTEFPPDTPPLPAHFPQRNRIIAGLSVGTVVVEAAQRSGSLITARLAGEYNREVFAVPGSVRSANSRGTHALIKQGVRLVENEMDIIDELQHFVHVEPGPAPPESAGRQNGPVMDSVRTMVYNHLDPYPKHIDIVIESTGLESGRVAAVLLDMEMSGLIVRHPGNYFSKSEE